jgi:hypothetical protein
VPAPPEPLDPASGAPTPLAPPSPLDPASVVSTLPTATALPYVPSAPVSASTVCSCSRSACKSTSSTVTCTRCGHGYCGASCQTLDWHHHKVECNTIFTAKTVRLLNNINVLSVDLSPHALSVVQEQLFLARHYMLSKKTAQLSEPLLASAFVSLDNASEVPAVLEKVMGSFFDVLRARMLQLRPSGQVATPTGIAAQVSVVLFLTHTLGDGNLMMLYERADLGGMMVDGGQHTAALVQLHAAERGLTSPENAPHAHPQALAQLRYNTANALFSQVKLMDVGHDKLAALDEAEKPARLAQQNSKGELQVTASDLTRAIQGERVVCLNTMFTGAKAGEFSGLLQLRDRAMQILEIPL